MPEWLPSPTLRDALGQVVRYARLVHDRLTLSLVPEGENDGARLTVTSPDIHQVNRYQIEFFMADLLRLARDTARARLVVKDDLASASVSVDRVARQLAMSAEAVAKRQSERRETS